MDQPRRGRRSACAEVALLQQDNPQAAPGGVARKADAVQATADNRKIVIRHAQAIAFSSEACPALDAGWIPVRVKKTRQIKSVLAGLARRLHAIARAAADRRGVLPDRRGFANEIALHRVAALVREESELLLGFHALGDDRH